MLQSLVKQPAQLLDAKGAAWVSTFGGGVTGGVTCISPSGWSSLLGAVGSPIRFMPAFFDDLNNAILAQVEPEINGDFLVSVEQSWHCLFSC